MMEPFPPEILGTKLYIPRVRSRIVHRDRLTTRLEAGLNCAVTLVCAPAGFGKTTLLVDWLRMRESATELPFAVAWVSLDEGDNDPVRFVQLLAGALRIAVPGIGGAALAVLRAARPMPLKIPFTALINELLASPREIILVLEDYHAIRQPIVHEGIAFLLEHLPPRFHVAIATRDDPPLPLIRLRARGAVSELRAADLRFTTEETIAFLREVMQLPVSAEEAAILHARTEGWIVGLQLAGLSLPGDDVAGFVAAFGGTHRNILDYLRGEVLARQRPAVQSFLLRSAVLGRFCGPLCDAVLGNEHPNRSRTLLEEIERRNLFLIPLDAERGWYRYHHLFADLLRQQLQYTQPAVIPDLHRRASAWYEEQGMAHPAIRHALAATEFERAASLIEHHGVIAIEQGQVHSVLDWFKDLPSSLVRARPLLGTICAYALIPVYQFETAEARLRDAEHVLTSDRHQENVKWVRGRIAMCRAFMAAAGGDLGSLVALATEAVRLLPAENAVERPTALAFAASAFRVSGDVSIPTERAMVEAVREAKAVSYPVLERYSLGLLGRLYMCQGRLRQAAAPFKEAAQVCDPRIPNALPMSAFGYGELLREWSDFDHAEAFLKQAIGAITATNLVDPYVVADGYVTLSRLQRARGDESGAMAALDAFTALANERKMGAAVMARAAAARVHLWLLQGNREAAVRWADTCGLGPEDPVSFLREPEYLTLARVLIARRHRAVLALLDRLLQNAESCERMGSAIQILVLRALALQALAAPAQALHALERALAVGEPEGYVRVFVDEGAPMATLLRRAHAKGLTPEYALRLLGFFGKRPADVGQSGPATASSIPIPPGRPEALALLVEPLTDRERDILRLLAAGASNHEVARRLFVATSTVKTHVHHIIGKLGVRSRQQAIAKAKALNLF